MFLPVWKTNYSIKWPNPRRKLMRKVVNVEEGPEVGLSPPPFPSTFLPPFPFPFGSILSLLSLPPSSFAMSAFSV